MTNGVMCDVRCAMYKELDKKKGKMIKEEKECVAQSMDVKEVEQGKCAMSLPLQGVW